MVGIINPLPHRSGQEDRKELPELRKAGLCTTQAVKTSECKSSPSNFCRCLRKCFCVPTRGFPQNPGGPQGNHEGSPRRKRVVRVRAHLDREFLQRFHRRGSL